MIVVLVTGGLLVGVATGWFIYGIGFRHGRGYERLQRQSTHYYRPVDQVLRVR